MQKNDIKLEPSYHDKSTTIEKVSLLNHRPNIKRTPAFRRDKGPIRNNNFNEKFKSSVVSHRVNLFNKKDDIGRERLSFFKDTSKQCNVDSTDNIHDMNNSEESQGCIKIRKACENAKNLTNKEQISFVSDIIPTEVTDMNFEVKSSTERVKKINYAVNKENTFSNLNFDKSSEDVNENLSDTLKRVLRSPLPPGPPPKKPPRIFTSWKWDADSDNRAKNNFRNYDCHFDTKSQAYEHPWQSVSKIPQFKRWKTESEIKLKKIENALMEYDKSISSPKLSPKITSPTDSNAEKFASIHKNKRTSSHSSSQFPSCFSSNMKCSGRSNSIQYTSSPYFPVKCSMQSRDNHIYQDLGKLNLSLTSSTKEVQDDTLYYMSTPIDEIVSPFDLKLEPIVETRNVNVIHDVHSNDDFHDLPIDNKIKFWMNEAYSNSWPKSSDAGSDSNSAFSLSQVKLCDELVSTRKGYVQRVASRALFRKQSLLSQPRTGHKLLFECILLIGLNVDAQNKKVPYIKMKFPDDTNVPQWVEHMCFPDAYDWGEITCDDNFKDDRCYVIPLTTEEGLRKYAYCRRMKPEGEFQSLPLTYCILSIYKATEFYFLILEEIENRHGQSEVEFNMFIKVLYENRFPVCGQGIRITSYSTNGKEMLKDELLIRQTHEDSQLSKTLAFVKIDLFLAIFSSLLLERKIVLLSSSISKLSTCVEGLQIALLPFEWQHTLITVVPSNIISVADLCDAPTPYLIGLHKSKNNSTPVLPTLNNKIQVLVVDLDEKKVLRKVGDENSILPNHLAKGLKNALQMAHSSEMHANNLLFCKAFTRFFVEAIGHYQRYIIVSGDGIKQRKSFHKEACVKAGASHQIRMFLEWFVETASFAIFITDKLQNNSSKGLFDRSCAKYLEDVNKSKYEKNKLNKTVKHIGDLIKDWTTN